MSNDTYLPDFLPAPTWSGDELEKPFWIGLDDAELRVQQCDRCDTWIFGPEWICYACHSFDLTWKTVEPVGTIFSWTRVWQSAWGGPPYLVVVVELPQAGGIRLVGNLLGDPLQEVPIGAGVTGVFERHARPAQAAAELSGGYGAAAAGGPPRSDFTLLQWEFAAH